MLLVLALGLGLGGRPVSAMAGIIYPLGGYHGMGQFQLQVIGPSVLLNVTAKNAPARQYQTGQKPTILFHLPETWRPATPVTWEVEAWPVLSDGTPDPQGTGPHVFTIQVDTQGVVRYLDSAQLGTAEFVRYQTTLAWPVSGADPQVCARSDEVRVAILEALTPAAGSRPQCGTVTWNQLATIRTLGRLEQPDRDPIRVIHAHDLAGLYGLEEASLFFAGTRWQPELLAHVPRLRRLWLETTLFLEQLPEGALNAVPLPALTHLTVVGESLQTMPDDWLRHLPGLTHLHLDLDNLDLRSVRGRVPRLEWESPPPTQSLTHLRVYMVDLANLNSDWRPHWPAASALTHLELVLPPITRLPVDWLPDLPNLTHLTLDASGDHARRDRTQNLEGFLHGDRILSHEFLGSLTTLPPNLLASVPALTRLTLYADGLTAWPTGLLHPVPGLTHLTLDVRGLATMPADLLVPVPDLTHLTLYADGLTAWPAGLLRPIPGLTHVALDVDGLTALPADFLVHAPDLTHLTLYADGLTALPEHLLVSQTRLEELGLYADSVAELPPGFLSDAPRLRKVYLWSGCLTGVPRDFLRNTSHEVQVNREGGSWQDLPEHLWVHLWDLNWSDNIEYLYEGSAPHQPLNYYRGPHVTITATLANLLDRPSLVQGRVVGQADAWDLGSFPVIDHHVDATGHAWLRLQSPSLLDLDSEEIWIAADHVALVDPYQLTGCQAD
ncbi:MAG: hypothetical protein OXG36_10605 [Caldilineaceae bacterium]|nr:hypothetical protein [Caldilineaceae bacterium]